MRRKIFKYIPVCVVLAMMTWGCAQDRTLTSSTATKVPAAQKEIVNVYKGKVVGKSNKAKTISIVVGKGDKAQTMMVKFDSKTKGVKYAAKGEAAIITWEMRGSDRVATVIKPKLAKLPEGISEIKPKELKKLIDSGADIMLVDCRPKKPYAQAHLPGAVSIPVDQMKTAQKLFPADKDKLLLFYCGGYT